MVAVVTFKQRCSRLNRHEKAHGNTATDALLSSINCSNFLVKAAKVDNTPVGNLGKKNG
ncbi:MAG: hypothetical protein CG439_1378 [Methylococcaceae bacterium NSP1-2]|nr:MAG: hypothetical protein CG439_1378 [Methylococcaceae bacterium NSP1-2]